MLKLEYVTQKEYEACAVVRRLMKRAYTDIARLNAVKSHCDLNPDSDPGGKRWKEAAAGMYHLVDRLYKEAGIDASDPAEIRLNGRIDVKFRASR